MHKALSKAMGLVFALRRFSRALRSAGVLRPVLVFLLWIAIAWGSTAAIAQTDPPDDNGTACGWDFFCHLQEFLKWAVCFLVDLIRPVLDQIFEFLPDEAIENASVAAEWIGVANSWFPIGFGLTLLSSYYVFIFVMVVIKLIMKAIPTIG